MKNFRTPKWLDRILVAIAALLALELMLATIPMIWGWYPVFGRSMQPTFPWIWGYYKVETVAKDDIKINDLIVVRGSVLGYAVKRVASIDPEKGLFLKGDNVNNSMDSSFGADPTDERRQVWVPFSEVVGRVNRIWSPSWAHREKTFAGRVLNWANFHFPPGWVSVCPFDNSVFVLEATIPGVSREDVMDVWSYKLRNGRWSIRHLRGVAYGWLPEGMLKLMVHTTPSSFDIRTEDGRVLEHVQLE